MKPKHIRKALEEKIAAVTKCSSMVVYRRMFPSFANFFVEAGTTGYQGGDAGHGCRAYFAIGADQALDVVINDGGDVIEAEKVGVFVAGDDELTQLIACLREAADVLEQQAFQRDVVARTEFVMRTPK